MLSSLVRGCGVVRLASTSPLASTSTSLVSASFSTSMWSSRWWSEAMANKKRKRLGYKDPTKQEGPLPRIKDDSPRIKQAALYKPNNDWSATRALAGQNDYIDILGSGELHPKQLLYHVPEYLKGAYHKEKHFQARRRTPALRLLLTPPPGHAEEAEGSGAHTLPEGLPLQVAGLATQCGCWCWCWWHPLPQMLAEHRWINRHVDQNWWANYRGTKEGPVRNPFKRRLF